MVNWKKNKGYYSRLQENRCNNYWQNGIRVVISWKKILLLRIYFVIFDIDLPPCKIRNHVRQFSHIRKIFSVDVQTVMSVCAKYNRIIRGFGGYCTTDFRGIVGKGDCWKFGSGRYEGVFIHGGAESGGEICKELAKKRQNLDK